MQFLIEVILLFVVFIMLRQVLVKTFPVQKLGMPVSADSLRALRQYRNRFLLLFILFSVFFSAVFFFFIRWIFVRIHYIGKVDFVWIVEDVSLVIPSVILSFLCADFFAEKMNNKLQKDGLSFFLDGYAEEQLGFRKKGLNKFQKTLGFMFALTLLVADFNVNVKQFGNTIEFNNFLREDKVVKVEEIAKVANLKKSTASLITIKGDTISLTPYGGDFSRLIKNK